MFGIACGAGAYEGKCDEREVLAIEQFAEKFGLLFQLRDDLLDFAVTNDLSGKRFIMIFGPDIIRFRLFTHFRMSGMVLN